MANDELMRLAQRVENLAWVPGHKHKLEAVVADLRALAQRASQHGAVPAEVIESAAKYGWEHASWDWENVRLGLGRFAAAPAPEASKCGPACARCGSTTGAACDERGCGYLTAGNGAPEAERAEGDAEDTFREFVEMCAEQAGGMVNGNRLSMLAKSVLSAHPAPPPAGQPEASPLTWVNPAPHASAPMEPQRTANYPVGFQLDESRTRAFIGQPEGVEATPHAIRAFKACIRDLKNMIEDASDYGLDEGHVGALETAVESIELRLASAQRAGKDGA